MYGYPGKMRRAQNSRKTNVVHTIYRESMTPKHGNYRKDNPPHLRRVERGGGDIPSRQSSIQMAIHQLPELQDFDTDTAL